VPAPPAGERSQAFGLRFTLPLMFGTTAILLAGGAAPNFPMLLVCYPTAMAIVWASTAATTSR
jgi:hypothetical protein